MMIGGNPRGSARETGGNQLFFTYKSRGRQLADIFHRNGFTNTVGWGRFTISLFDFRL